MFLILVGILLITLIYYKIIRPYNYWTDRGVNQRKQTYLLGDNATLILKKDNILDLVVKLYNAFPNERYMGVYQFLLPTLLIRDRELIKQITVKDFDHFVDHRSIVPDESDPLMTKNVFGLKGDKWRTMRATLSPAFTSNKMKAMFSLISECAATFIGYFAEMNEDTISVELKDAFSRYTNDVIATTAFGIKCDSMKEKGNDFFVMGKDATNFTGFWKNLKLALISLAPGLCKVLGITLFTKELREFFQRIVTETIRTREENNIIRPDMLHLLMEARKGRQKVEEENDISADTGFATVEESSIHTSKRIPKEELTDLDITAQAFIFFFGGFDTISTAMSFMAHELATHPDIQRKLQDEIDAIKKENKEKLTYETLVRMKYMDMVVSETLRLWTPGILTDRVCVKPYTIEPVKANEKPVHLKVGDVIWIPVIGFHKDPQFFPNPDVFDPERFSDENKGGIQPYTYLPFGLGPRNCIGSRFAILEMKTLFFHLLANFDLVPTEKTGIPLKFKSAFNLIPENGFWIGFRKRTQN